MRSLLENKRLIVLLAALALGALTLLAISLNGVPFREAQHFGREEVAASSISAEDVTQVWSDVPFWKQIFIWLLLLLAVVLISLLLSPALRKRMLVMLIRVIVTVGGILFLFRFYGDQLTGLLGLFRFGSRGMENAQEGSGSGAPAPVFEPPQVSPAFSYLISFAFALLWLALLWGFYRGWKKYLQYNTKKPLEEIAQIARASLDDLSSGRNSSDVIINCYLRMSDVVSSRRHLQREIAMTPREFAARLEQAGLPGEAVKQLTRLFEGVRYGDRKSAPRDVNEAVNCLKTILNYCGEPV